MPDFSVLVMWFQGHQFHSQKCSFSQPANFGFKGDSFYLKNTVFLSDQILVSRALRFSHSKTDFLSRIFGFKDIRFSHLRTNFPSECFFFWFQRHQSQKLRFSQNMFFGFNGINLSGKGTRQTKNNKSKNKKTMRTSLKIGLTSTL